MSYTFEGDVDEAARWLPFAQNQQRILNKLKMPSRVQTPSDGVTITIRTDHIHIQAGSQTGFLYLHRYTAADEALDPANVAGTISGRHDILSTSDKGFGKIVKGVPKLKAGTKYWTDGKELLSWNVNISPQSFDGIPYGALIGRSRFGDNLFKNGKKVGHQHGSTICATKVQGGTLAIVANNSAFDTLYSVGADYWRFKTYFNMMVKKVCFSQDGTKLVVIAATGVTKPSDFPVNSLPLFNNLFEAVVEYAIAVTPENLAQPVLLNETSRTTQYCQAALGKHLFASRVIDAKITEAESIAYVPPDPIITVTACGTMTISRRVYADTYGMMTQWGIEEVCSVDIQTFGNGKVMCPDDGNGAVSSITATSGTEPTGHDEFLWTGGDRVWFVSSTKTWTLTDTKLSLVTVSTTIVNPIATSNYNTTETTTTLVYDTHAVSTAAEMVMDAWYDKDGVLQKETVTSARYFKQGKYSYTINHPYLGVKNCTFDKPSQYSKETFVRTSTASYLFENEYYIEDIITEDMAVVATGGGYIENTTPPVTNSTLNNVISDPKEAIVFAAIAEKTNASNPLISGGLFQSPFYPEFPYPLESTSGYRPVVNLTVQESIFGNKMLLSDRWGNKLMMYMENGETKIKAFEVKPTPEDPLALNYFTPVSAEMLATISAAIYSANDIIGVV